MLHGTTIMPSAGKDPLAIRAAISRQSYETLAEAVKSSKQSEVSQTSVSAAASVTTRCVSTFASRKACKR